MSPDGQTLVYLQRVPHPELVIEHLPTQTRTVLLHADFLAWDSAGTRAYIYKRYRPSEVLELDVATGVRKQILAAEFYRVEATPDGRALLMRGRRDNTWIYFIDTEELRHLTTAGELSVSVYYREDGRALALSSGTDLVYVDLVTHARVTLNPPERFFGFYSDAIVYRLPSGTLQAWHPDERKTFLGEFDPAIPEYRRQGGIYGRERPIVVDDTLTARRWNPADGTVEVVATDVTEASLSADEEFLAFIRREEDGKNHVYVKGLGTSVEREVKISPNRLTLEMGPGGRHLAVTEHWTDEIDPAYQSLELLDLATGQTVALSPPPPVASGGIFTKFIRNGSILHAFFMDKVEVLYDTATGIELYSTRKSVEPAEGAYSFLDPRERFFFMPTNAYHSNFSDLYVWNIETRREHFLGPTARVWDYFDDRVLVMTNVPDILPFRADFVVWDSTSGQIYPLAREAVAERGSMHEGVLFREELDTSVSRPAGRLTWAALDGTRKLPIAERVYDAHVQGDSLYYSTETTICRLPTGALGPR